MKLYRAVPAKGFDANTVHIAQVTRRTPSNVPYLVDNIWEWLRPESAPSRRHAAYASPSPLIALSSASSAGEKREEYVICEIECDLSLLRLAHLNVTDAKLHGDIRKLMRFMVSLHGNAFADLPLNQKVEYAPLYLPAVSKEELNDYFTSSTQRVELGKQLRALSTFWQDTQPTPQYEHQGELFFELPAGASYKLKPLTPV